MYERVVGEKVEEVSRSQNLQGIIGFIRNLDLVLSTVGNKVLSKKVT